MSECVCTCMHVLSVFLPVCHSEYLISVNLFPHVHCVHSSNFFNSCRGRVEEFLALWTVRRGKTWSTHVCREIWSLSRELLRSVAQENIASLIYQIMHSFHPYTPHVWKFNQGTAVLTLYYGILGKYVVAVLKGRSLIPAKSFSHCHCDGNNIYCHHPQVSQSQEARGGKGDKCMFLLYVDASSIINGKGRGTGTDSVSVGIEFSLKDYYGIQVRPSAVPILVCTLKILHNVLYLKQLF